MTLTPTTGGIQGAIGKAFSGADVEAEKAGKKSGNKFSDAIGGVVKKGALAVGVAAGGVLATALFKGWNRLAAIENAEAKLKGLGNSASTVKTVMNNALAAVKGTAFGLGDAATIAASAVAAGVKPGKDLQRTLGLVADAATIGGVSIGEMGAVFNKVASANKIQGDVINQLNDKGIPIVQLLGKTMGKTAEEVTKLASDGKIDFATFQQAMESGLGGAALKSGKTTEGAFKNMGAALGRFGATLMKDVFPLAKVVFGGITSSLDTMAGAVAPAVAAVGGFFGKIAEGAKALASNPIAVSSFGTLRDVFSSLWDSAQKLVQPVKDIVSSLAVASAAIGISVWQIFLVVLQGVAGIVSAVVVPFVTELSKRMKENQVAVIAIVGAFTAWRAVLAGIALGKLIVGLAASANGIALNTIAWAKNAVAMIASKVETLALMAMYAGSFIAGVASATAGIIAQSAAWVANTAKMVAGKAIQLAVVAATVAWTGAQWLLNAALNANPLGLIIAGIVLLVGAIILAWNKSEGFRDVVVAVWAAIMAAVSAVVSWFAGPFAAFFTTTLPGIFSSAWNFMLKIVQTVWNAIASFFASALAAFVGFFTGIWNTISSIFASVWNSISSVAISVWGGISSFFSGAFSSFTGFFSDTWNGIVSTFSSIFGGIKDIASSIWDGVLGVFKDGVNAVTGFINTWFIDKINAVTGIFGISEIPHIPVWQESGGFLGQAGMPMLAKGGSVGKGFRTSGPMAIVGEGNPLYPELVIPTDPKYRDNARKLMKYGASKIPMYESGGVVGGPEKVESSTGVVGYILDHTLKPIMDGIKGILPKGFIGDWARGIMDKMYIGIQDFLGVKEEKGILGGLGDYQGGAGVEQWRDTALQALALAGQSAAWIDKLLMQMNSESGGNPHAINNWDINAQNGIPSKGLMQTIDPTFNAYAGPLAGRGVYDPLANIYAAIMYTLSQYGSLGIWSGKGYASGGITTGATLALIGEGKEQEALLPLSKLNALLAEPRGTTSSGMANTFNMYELGDPVANSVAVNRRLSSLAAV